MNLYIGGFGQGKLNYVLEQLADKQGVIVCDGAAENPMEQEGKDGIFVFNHFHLWVRNLLLQEKDAKEETESLLKKFPEIYIISDEIGNGIVPVEPFERKYRDAVGEILILLAKKAERVERILCGLGQTLKSN